MSAIDVTVIIAAYRSEDFLAQAIGSALAQEQVSLEVIVVDDASPDPLDALVSSIAPGDDRLKFYRLARNAGPSGARNHGIQAARGKYIAVLDADDTMRPGRLARMVQDAEALQADILVDNLIIDRTGQAQDAGEKLLETKSLTLPFVITLPDYLNPNPDGPLGGQAGYLKPLLRRDFLLNSHTTYDPALRNSEDFYLVAELLAKGAKMVLIDRADYLYRIHDGSISNRISPQNARAVLTKERQFRSTYASVLCETAARMSDQRLSWLTRQYVSESIISDLKQKRLTNVVAIALRYPLPALGAVGKLFSISLRKLLGREQKRFEAE